MSHHEAPSTPYQQHENYSPISTTVSPVSQRFHTPKRRRVGSGSMPDFDPAAPSFVPGQDLFDFSFPPALDLGHHSPPPVNQNHGPFSSNWDIGFRYDDLQSFGVPPDQPEIQRRPSQPLVTRPDFSSFLQYSSEPPRLHREPVGLSRLADLTYWERPQGSLHTSDSNSNTLCPLNLPDNMSFLDIQYHSSSRLPLV